VKTNSKLESVAMPTSVSAPLTGVNVPLKGVSVPWGCAKL
jgi:hypothetical protein